MNPPTNLYNDLEFRGLVKQVTHPELAQALEKERLTLYAGFDPTSDSLHIGSLLPIITLKRFQNAGHRVIALAGGATGMIGDPSGKGQERSLLTEDLLQKNLDGMRKELGRFLDPEGPNAALLVNNADWFRGISYIDFLRDVGKHFTVNHMMAKESVRTRLEDREHGISYTEFSYMLLQAYDFYVLNRDYQCRLQVGGSDQWGNITAGIELIRRLKTENSEVFGLTHPLVTKADGGKFGKTETGTIWLDSAKTSPYRFYQYLIQTPDADAVTFLKYFTFLSHDEINRLEKTVQEAPEKREAQTTLARELTRWVHGEKELKNAENASRALFGEVDLTELDERTLLDVFSEAPSTEKNRAVLEGSGYPLVDALAESGLSQSKGMARKDLAGGGIYVNQARVSDGSLVLKSHDLISGSYIILRKGKKTYHLIRFK